MIELGIARPSDSKWSSPLHMVKKTTPGDRRPCGDYRALNGVTVPDRDPLPHIHDYRCRLGSETLAKPFNASSTQFFAVSISVVLISMTFL